MLKPTDEGGYTIPLDADAIATFSECLLDLGFVEEESDRWGVCERAEGVGDKAADVAGSEDVDSREDVHGLDSGCVMGGRAIVSFVG